MNPSDFVIVIGRQFGSGGRRLGKLLATRLGIPYYDKELLSKASEEQGFRADLFEKADERRPSLFASLLSANYGASSYFIPGALQSSTLYQMQSDVIRKLIASPCVIVGRTADYIGRDKENLVSIFVHADDQARVKRICEREKEGITPAKAKERMNKLDNDRKTYYNYFTGRRWGHADNYHLCLSSSQMDVEQLADVVCHYLAKRCESADGTAKH